MKNQFFVVKFVSVCVYASRFQRYISNFIEQHIIFEIHIEVLE